jgi:hypothetical protein
VCPVTDNPEPINIAHVAAFIIKMTDDTLDATTISREAKEKKIAVAVHRRWPGLNLEQFNRAYRIAQDEISQARETLQEREHRLRKIIAGDDPVRAALLTAALKVHPLWQRAQWVGEDGPPSVDEMIDWFQRNHPKEAREIEDRFDETF